MTLLRTYQLAEGPAPEEFDRYAERATAEYQHLLASNPMEGKVQEFFEENPCFVPGATSPGSHGPLHDALISQPILPGLRSRRPDFLWITKHSAKWFPMLIEIERPDKKVFRQDGVPTAEFTEARHQIAQWRAWFGAPENVQKFVAEYGVPDHYLRFCSMEPRYILIVGRRSEFSDDPEKSKLRSALMPAPDEELISYDRIVAARDRRDAITVRPKGTGRYEVRRVMPTMKLDAMLAGRLTLFDNLQECIRVDDRIPAGRRQFMLTRIPYWVEWARQGRRGIVGGDDGE
jgi:hypothetical protein